MKFHLEKKNWKKENLPNFDRENKGSNNKVINFDMIYIGNKLQNFKGFLLRFTYRKHLLISACFFFMHILRLYMEYMH